MHGPDAEMMRAVDAENLPWLESVIAEVDWPGRSMVGDDGASAAWLHDEGEARSVLCSACGTATTLRLGRRPARRPAA